MYCPRDCLQFDRSQMARAKGTRAATIRQRNVNRSSTKRQPVINQASTERQPVINETSTEHQIGDFLDENGNNATLVAINGTRSMVWLTGMPGAVRRAFWSTFAA